MDNTSIVVKNGIVQNDLTWNRIWRKDVNSAFTCRAINNNITAPVDTTVVLNMNRR